MNSLVIAGNVIRRILKEVNGITFLILFPILAGLLAVLMFSSGSALEIGVANVPQNDYDLIRTLEDTDKYVITYMNEEDIKLNIENKTIVAGLIFPEGFSEAFNTQTPAKIELISLRDDPSTQQLRGVIEGYYGSLLQGIEFDISSILGNSQDEGQQAKTALGMLSMFIIMFVGTGIAMLLEDKQLKTFGRTFYAPLREYEMALGHLLANIFLGVIQILIFMVTTTFVFNFEWRISLASLFIILFIYLLAAIGFSIGIAGFFRDNQKYNIVLMLFAVATSFLSGGFFPLEYLNDFIRRISNFVPQKWVLDSFTKLSQGNSLTDIYVNLAIILLFGIVFFTFGVKVLKPTAEDL